MMKYKDDTVEARKACAEAVDHFIRLRRRDFIEAGHFDGLDDDEKAAASLEGQFLNAWVVVGMYQGLDEPETCNVLVGTSTSPVPTIQGLLSYAMEQ